MKIQNKKNNRQTLIISLVIAVIVIGLAVYWQKDTISSWFSRSDNGQANDTGDDTKGDNNTDSNDDSNNNGQDDNDSDTTDNNSNNTDNGQTGDNAKTVTVIINDAAQYGSNIEVRAYIQGVIETDGLCTLTFTKGSSTITRTAAPLSNPSYTSCETAVVPVSEFASKGAWQLTVSYASSTSKGSASRSLEIK